MQQDLNLLMLGGAKRVAMARRLKQAGAACGRRVNIFSHELSAQEPIASEGAVITGGRYSAPGIDDEIDGIIARHGINIVLPFVDPAIEVAARCRLRHSDDSVFVPVSSPELSRQMFDKSAAARLFAQCGLPIPATYHPDDIRYPAILKPRTGSASRGIIVARSDKDLAEAPLPPDQYLMQEYLEQADEYTVDCYVGTRDGEVKCAVPRRRLATAGGEVTRTVTERDPELCRLSVRVLTALGLRGAVTLQFLRSPSRRQGQYALMEINPRLGGGVICSIAAGADIAAMIIAESLGRHVAPCTRWRDKTLMTRYFQEVIFHND